MNHGPWVCFSRPVTERERERKVEITSIKKKLSVTTLTWRPLGLRKTAPDYPTWDLNHYIVNGFYCRSLTLAAKVTVWASYFGGSQSVRENALACCQYIHLRERSGSASAPGWKVKLLCAPCWIPTANSHSLQRPLGYTHRHTVKHNQSSQILHSPAHHKHLDPAHGTEPTYYLATKGFILHTHKHMCGDCC